MSQTCRDVRSGPVRVPGGGGPEGFARGEHHSVSAHGSGEDASRCLRGPQTSGGEDAWGQSGGPGQYGNEIIMLIINPAIMGVLGQM